LYQLLGQDLHIQEPCYFRKYGQQILKRQILVIMGLFLNT